MNLTEGKYILDENGNPSKTYDLTEWAKWFEKNNRTVKKEVVGDSTVSTVFLSIDHSFGDGPPVLWETMVFGGELDQEQDRCGGVRKDAELMHSRMVERVKEATHADHP